jgi:hypothetical protein
MRLAGGLAFYLFLDEFIAAAAVEYGIAKVSKYVKEKLPEQLKNPRNDGAKRSKFMLEMLRRINSYNESNSKKKHPLSFLVDENTLNWKGRYRGNEFHPAVQAGHTLSFHGGGFAFVVEDAESNQARRADTIESKGLAAWSVGTLIGDVPVDLGTAMQWIRLNKLKLRQLGRPTVGWIDF